MIARIRVIEPDSKAEQPKQSARSRPQPDQTIKLALGKPGSPLPREAYRFKPTSFALSVFLHAGIVAALLTVGSSDSAHTSSRPIYDAEIRPHESKIVWYQFKRGLPSINSTVPIRQSDRPTATTKSPNTIIAIPEDRQALQQFIARESDKLIDRDLKAPNLVAVTAPPPPQESPKTVTPPRPFVAPPSQPRPRIEAPTQIPDAPKLELPVAPITQPTLPDPSLMKRILPPPPPPPVVVVDGTPGSQGSSAVASNSNVQAVVVGLNPSERLAEVVPEGRRSANISTAPSSGRESTDINPAGATAPGLTTRGKAGANVDPGPAAASTVRGSEAKEGILYRDAIAGPMPSTLSAPLRPSSRRIPAALESRFHNRTVYALSIPAPKLPEYSGYWTLWFAEIDPSADDMSQVRAPLPYRRAGAARPATSSTTELRVQVALVIDEEGKVDSLTLQGTPIEKTQAVLADIGAWQFKPATKNGKPVRVEVVLEIPYRLAPQIAQN